MEKYLTMRASKQQGSNLKERITDLPGEKELSSVGEEQTNSAGAKRTQLYCGNKPKRRKET